MPRCRCRRQRSPGMIDPGTLEHKHTHLHTSTHPSCISCGSGWRIHCCSVEVTELSTNKQHTLSSVRILFGFFSFVGIRSLPMHSNGRQPMYSNGREPMSASGLSLAHHGSHVGLPLALSEWSDWQYRSKAFRHKWVLGREPRRKADLLRHS